MGYRFPWYDSNWLAAYVAAKDHVAHHHPQRLAEFTGAFAALRTTPDFKVKKLDRVFDDGELTRIREVIKSLAFDKLELHEAEDFGRIVVHNHPIFTEMQRAFIPLVSALAGEAVEPNYNFLSLYSTCGVCPIHMDAPEAKWTLDVCIDQSEPWPIHFSSVVPWPEDVDASDKTYQQWEDDFRNRREVTFEPVVLHPGEAALFSGSSQWHYRDRISGSGSQSFCNLLFFHFVPLGTFEIVRPGNWPRIFGIPELAGVVSDT